MPQHHFLSGALLFLVAQPTFAFELEKEITLTSDYVWRGVSQSQSSTAVQACLELEAPGGFTLGLWGSTVDFTASGDPDDGADVELNTYLRFDRDLSENWSASAEWVHYFYPGTHAGVDYDYGELSVGVEYGGTLGATVAYSDDVLATNEVGITWEVWSQWQLPGDLGLSATYGYADLDRAFGDGYRYFDIGIQRDWGRLTVGLNVTGTDNSGRELWGKSDTSTRGILSLSTGF